MSDGLYHRPRSPFWWVRFRFRGVEVRRSTGILYGTRTRSEAARVARGIRAEVESSGAAPNRGRGPLLADLAAADQEEAEQRGNGGGRVATLEYQWRNVLGYFGDVGLLEITYESVRRYEAARRAGAVVPVATDGKPRRTKGHVARGQTIREEVACLKRAWRIAKRRGEVRHVLDDWPEIRSDAPHPTRRGRLIPVRHLYAILQALPADLRDEIVFDALTGLRRAELGRVRPSWLRATDDCDYLEVPAEAAKDREMRIMPLRGVAWQVFQGRAREAVGDALLFPRRDRRKTILRACGAAGVPGHITYRDVRTTFANIAKRNSSGVQARDLLGHADERTTNIYMRSEAHELVATLDAVEAALGVGEWAHEPRTLVGTKKSGPPDFSSGPLTSLVEDKGFEPSTPTLRTKSAPVTACPCCVERCLALHQPSGFASNRHVCPEVVGTQSGHTDSEETKRHG